MRHLTTIYVTVLTAVMIACGGDDNATADSGKSGGGNQSGKLPTYISTRQLAFPGADGSASSITGGADGDVYLVTSLEDDYSTGTLRNALVSGNRTIVFAVGGQINLKSKLNISGENITIAGQTAPGDGITIAGYPVFIKGNNIILRYLRFRMGDQNGDKDNFDAEDGDALGAKDGGNIMIDHCSCSWSTDECLSMYGVKDATVQYCIVSESLNNSVHAKGAHGYAGIWGGKKASFHHNLLAHNDSRMIRFDHGYVSTLAGPVDLLMEARVQPIPEISVSIISLPIITSPVQRLSPE